MIERNIARIALPKMLVGLFVARVDDDQMEESREMPLFALTKQ